jgi:hypothetical protein
MAQISLKQAALQKGIPRQTLEAWARQGLLTLQPSRMPSGSQATEDSRSEDQLVDEDELNQVIESVGWLQISDRDWENAEER